MRLALLGAILNVLDMATTIVAVGYMGAIERNPLIADVVLEPWFWATKVAFITSIFWATAYVAQKNKVYLASLLAMVGIMALVVMSNIAGIISTLGRL